MIFLIYPAIYKSTVGQRRWSSAEELLQAWCNYTGTVLTLGKMMRNEHLMKTLPEAARQIYVLFHSCKQTHCVRAHTPLRSRLERNKGSSRNDRREEEDKCTRF